MIPSAELEQYPFNTFAIVACTNCSHEFEEMTGNLMRADQMDCPKCGNSIDLRQQEKETELVERRIGDQIRIAREIKKKL